MTTQGSISQIKTKVKETRIYFDVHGHPMEYTLMDLYIQVSLTLVFICEMLP
jgi:hypothetical protein